MSPFTFDTDIDPKEVAAILAHPQMGMMRFADEVTPAVIVRAMTSGDTGVTICRVNGAAAGIIAIRYLNPICVKIAVGFLEAVRGKVAVMFFKNFVDSMFKAGVCKIVGEIAAPNKLCLRMAGVMGFRREGVNRQAVEMDGKVVDLIYVGLTRGDWYGRLSSG